MIPYLSPPEFHIPLPFTEHHITLYGFGMCVAAAILFGSWVMQRRVAKLGLDLDTARDLLYAVFIGGFVGAHLVDVFVYRPAELAQDPLLLFKVWNGISSFGGFVGALAGVLVFFRLRPVSRERFWGYCEATTWALPFGWILGRLGCSLAHDHPGIKSDCFLAVATPPVADQQRYDLPDGPFLDLGMLEFGYTLLLCGVLLILDRKPRPVGFYITCVPILYAPVRFGLDFLRLRDARYLGLTPGQYIAIGLAVFAIWLWRRRPRGVYGFQEP